MATTTPSPTEAPVTVLLIDDQALIGEAVRRMLGDQPEITYHFCQNPTEAIARADLVQPTVILQDLVMPEIDGLEMVRRFRQHEPTRDVPLIVLSSREEAKTKAEAFALGANDYLVKLPEAIELVARIRYHSQGYTRLLQRNAAYRQLQEDVAQAARYVQSLLPEPIAESPIQTDWTFIPSAALGGDTFGYHFLDDDRFAFYLVDVVGHGVGAALLSVSVLNAIRSRSLPSTDFRDPGQVIAALNRTFQMAQQGDKYFTAWYGVYDRSSRRIRYSGGGHPPAILVPGPGSGSTDPILLEADGPMVGAFEDLDYGSAEIDIVPGSRIYLFSDGVYEVADRQGTMWPFSQFVKVLVGLKHDDGGELTRLVDHVRQFTGAHDFEDDYSILSARFS